MWMNVKTGKTSVNCKGLEVDGTIPLNRWFKKEKIGVGSGGRTHDIQSHSLAFCH